MNGPDEAVGSTCATEPCTGLELGTGAAKAVRKTAARERKSESRLCIVASYGCS
jgi:hypothetical protein